jgi:hypothetical protein
MLTTGLVTSFSLAALSGGYLYSRKPHLAPLTRWIIAAAPVIFLFLLLIILLKMIDGAFLNLSMARLTPTIAIAQGHDLYQGAGSGPLLNTIYPPLAYLIFLPAALASTPTGALLIAAVINSGLFFVPLFLLAIHAAKTAEGNTNWLSAALACAFIIVAAFSNPITGIIAVKIHADAPTIGIGMLSCLMLIKMRTSQIRPLLIAGFLLASSVWIKQTAVGLFAAQALYLWLAWDFRTLLRYTLITTGAGLIYGLIFFVWFDFDAMLFNIFFLPSQHIVDLSLYGILEALTFLFNESFLLIFIIVLITSCIQIPKLIRL